VGEKTPQGEVRACAKAMPEKELNVFAESKQTKNQNIRPWNYWCLFLPNW
jgi:hypothetical protein